MAQYSIGCREHQCSDSRFVGGPGEPVWFEDREEAQERADKQSYLHRMLGMDCEFIVRDNEAGERPILDEADMAILLSDGHTEESIAELADILPTL